MSTRADQQTDFQGIVHDFAELLRPTSPINRACLVMLAAAVTAFVCAALLTFPGIIFSHGAHNCCFLFSQTLQTDHASLLPVFLSGLSSALSLALPVARPGFHPKHTRCTSNWAGVEPDWRG